MKIMKIYVQAGTDRRMKLKSQQFDKNIGARQKGKEVPASLKVSKIINI